MPAAAGPMAQLVNQKGEPLHLVEPEADSADHLPVFEPLYSRSSIMTFVLSEVLLQALTLMNSPQQRGRRAHAETPRRLRRIVLTLPTGMHVSTPSSSSRSSVPRSWVMTPHAGPLPSRASSNCDHACPPTAANSLMPC